MILTAIGVAYILSQAGKNQPDSIASSDESGSESSGSDGFDDSVWRRFDSQFKKYGSLYGVDWRWLKATALNESSLGTHPSVALGLRQPSNVVESQSEDGKSWGLMQVTLTTARDLDPQATAPKLNDADYSINLAARYFSRLKKYFNDFDPRYLEFVVKSYNQGPGNSLKEKAGTGGGYADEYWDRWQRNFDRVNERL